MASIQQSLNQLTQSFAHLAYQSGIAKSFKLSQEKKEEAIQAKAAVEKKEAARQGYLSEIQTSQEATAKRMEEQIAEFEGNKSRTRPTVEGYERELKGMIRGEQATAAILQKEYGTNPYAADPSLDPVARVERHLQRLYNEAAVRASLRGGKK